MISIAGLVLYIDSGASAMTSQMDLGCMGCMGR